eukprot:g40947.t1
MAANDPLDVDAGRTVGEDKGDPITLAGGKREDEGQSAGDGLDPVNNGAGESWVEEEGGYFRGCLVEVDIIGTDAIEMEELGEWNRVFTGSRVRDFVVK